MYCPDNRTVGAARVVPPQPAQVRAPASTPGIEMRQVLLILGASCLVAALAAGTALVCE